MNRSRFEHVVVIGYGVIAGNVLKKIHSCAFKYGYTEEYIEYEVHPFNNAKRFAEIEEISIYVIREKGDLTKHFERLLNKKTLIISANNNYIFPVNIISNKNATIINYHNALLPEFPGRNAASWAIYEGKNQTGITWHYVTEDIDAGDIIVQRICKITADMKAYELSAKQMKIAAEAFYECYETILKETASTTKQNISEDRKKNKSYDIPGQGKFDLKDSPERIYRLLRAMDYGKNEIFPLPQSIKDKNIIQIRRYKKVGTGDLDDCKDKIYIPINSENSLVLRYETLKNTEKNE